MVAVYGTKYDSEIKTRMFFVRGSERYTNTTFLSIVADKMQIQQGESVLLTGILLDKLQRPLPNKLIRFYDGNAIIGSVLTDREGIATLSTIPTSINSFNCRFDGDEGNLDSVSENIHVSVGDERIVSRMFLNPDVSSINYNESIYGYLVDENDNPIVDERIEANVNGSRYLSVTNQNGRFRILAHHGIGTFLFTFIFEGNATHKPFSFTKTITITDPYLYYDDMSRDKTADYVFDSLRGNFVSNPPTITLDKNPTNITANVQKVNASSTGEAYYLLKDFNSENFKYEVTIEKTADFSAFTTVFFNETKDRGVIYQFSGATNTLYMGTMSKNGSTWTLSSIGSNNIPLTNGEEYIFELKRVNNTATGTFTQKSNGTVLATRTGTLPSGFGSNVHIGMGFSNFTTTNNNISKTLIKEVKAEEIT